MWPVLTDPQQQQPDFLFFNAPDKMQTKNHNFFTGFTLNSVDMTIPAEGKYLLKNKA